MEQLEAAKYSLVSTAAGKGIRTALLSCILFSCSLLAAQPAPPPDQRSTGTAQLESTHSVVVPMTDPDHVSIFTEFDKHFNNGRGVSDADNTYGQLAWLQSYQMLAYIQMYHATSDNLWLDKIAEQFARVLECRDDRVGRVDIYAKRPLKAWGTAYYDKRGWHAWVVHTGMVCQGPAEFVRLVKSTPELQKDYGTTATHFLSEIEDMVADADQYFKTNQAGEGWYVDPGIGGSGGIVPLNMSNAMGSVLIELHAATGKPEYKDKAAALATYFKNCLRDNGDGGYNWAYWPKSSDDPTTTGEDVSHASLNVDFAARCATAGIVFDRKDMEKFAQTWLGKVDKGNDQWAIRVDGTTGDGKAYYPQSPGRWLRLMEHLDEESIRSFYGSVASCFLGENINRPSRALGIANIARYKSYP